VHGEQGGKKTRKKGSWRRRRQGIKKGRPKGVLVDWTAVRGGKGGSVGKKDKKADAREKSEKDVILTRRNSKPPNRSQRRKYCRGYEKKETLSKAHEQHLKNRVRGGKWKEKGGKSKRRRAEKKKRREHREVTMLRGSNRSGRTTDGWLGRGSCGRTGFRTNLRNAKNEPKK